MNRSGEDDGDSVSTSSAESDYVSCGAGEEDHQQQAAEQERKEDEPAHDEAPALVQDAEQARAAKERGNAAFGAGDYGAASDAYSDAIALCPEDDAEGMATYLSNRAAAYLMLKKYHEAAEDCSEALRLKPDYPKCVRRRARCYEELENFSAALDDWKVVVDADPADAAAKAAVKRLEVLVAEQHEKQKAEMLSKLKELGNGLLGKFGLSLDNFKAVQDPKTGSYSISFGQGGGSGAGGPPPT